jgi:hypothetical protein
MGGLLPLLVQVMLGSSAHYCRNMSHGRIRRPQTAQVILKKTKPKPNGKNAYQ